MWNQKRLWAEKSFRKQPSRKCVASFLHNCWSALKKGTTSQTQANFDWLAHVALKISLLQNDPNILDHSWEGHLAHYSWTQNLWPRFGSTQKLMQLLHQGLPYNWKIQVIVFPCFPVTSVFHEIFSSCHLSKRAGTSASVECPGLELAVHVSWVRTSQHPQTSGCPHLQWLHDTFFSGSLSWSKNAYPNKKRCSDIQIIFPDTQCMVYLPKCG